MGFWIGDQHPFVKKAESQASEHLMTVGRQSAGSFLILANHPDKARPSGNSIIYCLGTDQEAHRSPWSVLDSSSKKPDAASLVEAYFVMEEYAKLNKNWIEVDPDLPIAAIEYRLLQTLGVIEK